MSLVVRVTRQNCTCAVDLLSHHQARQLVRQGHRPKREQAAAALPLGSHWFRPPIRRPNSKDEVLRTLISPCPEPRRQLVRWSVDGVLRNARDAEGRLMYRTVYDKKAHDVWPIP